MIKETQKSAPESHSVCILFWWFKQFSKNSSSSVKNTAHFYIFKFIITLPKVFIISKQISFWNLLNYLVRSQLKDSSLHMQCRQVLFMQFQRNYFTWVFTLKSGTLTAWNSKCVKSFFAAALMKTQCYQKHLLHISSTNNPLNVYKLNLYAQNIYRN